MKKSISMLILFVLVTAGSFAQTRTAVQDLNDAIRNGQVRLTANGNGSSSGMAVNGYLRNLTTVEIRININIDFGIYLANSGQGQNMLGTQVYLKGGKYSSDGVRDFIVLQPSINMEVSFLAFCVDLERDNPSLSETFSVGGVPDEITAIAAKINRFEREHPDEDVVTAGQLALWRSKGKTWTEISRSFKFNQNDWNNATVLLNY